jgi:hypothetical protein
MSVANQQSDSAAMTRSHSESQSKQSGPIRYWRCDLARARGNSSLNGPFHYAHRRESLAERLHPRGNSSRADRIRCAPLETTAVGLRVLNAIDGWLVCIWRLLSFHRRRSRQCHVASCTFLDQHVSSLGRVVGSDGICRGCGGLVRFATTESGMKGLPIADCQLPILRSDIVVTIGTLWLKAQIGNRQFAIGNDPH